VTTPKKKHPQNDRLTVRLPVSQEERRRDKAHVYTINVQSLMAAVGESQVVEIMSCLILVDHGVNVIEEY